MQGEQLQIWKEKEVIEYVQLILKSYRHWKNKELISQILPEEMSEDLFFAPFVVLSHGKQNDPLLCYGNKAALDLWEFSWAEMLKTPSRKTAEAMLREERARLLEKVNKKGFIDNYQGVRISHTGKKFYIKKAVVWNDLDLNNNYIGQAASFSEWEYVD